MQSISYAKLIGTTRNDRFINGEVDIKSDTTITYKVEIVMLLRILQYLIGRLQIDVVQSECIHSRKDLKAFMSMQKSLVVLIHPFVSDSPPCALSSCASFP